MEAAQLTGANKNKDRRKLDFYPTPPLATHALIRLLQPFISPNSLFWEPACGDGAMVDVIEHYGYRCVGSDINPGNERFLKQDYLKSHCPYPVDVIATNPPFNLSEEFILKAIADAPVVAMLVKSQYFHAKKRLRLFRENTPRFLCPLTWRLDFLNGAKGGRPTMEVMWVIWMAEKPDSSLPMYWPLEKPEL